MSQRSHTTFMGLYEGAEQRQTRGSTVRDRRKRERPPISSTDGRRRRGLGRDMQFNTNVTPDLFDSISDACARFDLTKAEFMERSARAYIDQLEAQNEGA